MSARPSYPPPTARQFSRRQILAGLSAVVAAGATLGLARSGVAAPLGQAAPVAYRVPGLPYDSATGFNVGPDAWNAVYGINRQFFPVTDRTRWGVVWQSKAADGPDRGAIFVTWFGPDVSAADNTVRLQQTEEVLAAAASDEAGTIYTLTIQAGSGAPNNARRVTLTRRAADGATNSVNPDAGPEGLNIVSFSDSNTAAMQVANGQVAVMIARTMHRSNDGLNHQGGIARVFDGATLALTQSHGQTSSHSWSSMLTRNAAGQFVAIEIGDNFPRGIQIHRFDGQRRASRVIYTFKTAHGTEPTSPAGQAYPEYTAASTPQQKYYQWSNDNQVYTELGGVAETNAGYLVVFAGERPSLDNSKVGRNLNVGRDLAAIVVRKDFEAASRGDGPAWVTDDLIVSQGAPPEEGGFYTFTGGFSRQRTKGVVWLTNNPADRSRNVSRVKIAPLPNGDVQLLWEVWGPDAYLETMTMTVRPNGTAIDVVKPAASLGTALRLNPRDDLLVRDGKVLVVSGDGPNRQLLLTTIDPGLPITAIPAPPPTAAPPPPAQPTPVPPPPAQPTPAPQPTAAPAAVAPPPPANPPAGAPPTVEVAMALADAVFRGWNTNAGRLFFSNMEWDATTVRLTGNLTGAAPLTGNFVVNGTVTGADQISGAVTRDPADADQWAFTMTFAADRQSFTGRITGLVESLTGQAS